ncbi:MAG: CoA transferase, partial [Actinomycetota bacterium]|nr:CoA transferase [Actinomycetota bacterium]
MKRFSSIAALTALLLTAAACGDDSSSSSDTAAPDTSVSDTTSPETTSPATTVSDTTPDTTGDDVPQAIVSLSPTATEMLFAIGAGDQVIAVDDYSNYPAEALEIPHDLSGFEPNVEAIADLSRGKRSALIDLRERAGRAQLDALVAGADVFLQGYRPGALAARGYSAQALAARRPGIVVASLSAYGALGPWADRRGFDSLVQTATGFNLAEGEAAAAAAAASGVAAGP